VAGFEVTGDTLPMDGLLSHMQGLANWLLRKGWPGGTRCVIDTRFKGDTTLHGTPESVCRDELDAHLAQWIERSGWLSAYVTIDGRCPNDSGVVNVQLKGDTSSPMDIHLLPNKETGFEGAVLTSRDEVITHPTRGIPRLRRTQEEWDALYGSTTEDGPSSAS